MNNELIGVISNEGELEGVIEDNSFNVKVQIAESGPRGLPGKDGYTPIKGIDYFDGPQGIQGEQGVQGPRGETGPEGPKGTKGDTGSRGDKGDKGDIGLRGPEGPQGVKGDTGSRGPQGEIGPRGLEGLKGDKGDTGEQGPRGLQGPKGDPFVYDDFTPTQLEGLKGPQGIQGPKGDKGDTGEQGEQGLQGIQGIPGEQGEQGDKGETGSIDNLTKMYVTDALGYTPLPISNGVLENYREKLVILSGTSVTINLNNGNVFTHNLTGNTTYTISNAISGQAHSFTLIITQTATVRTLTFPSSVKWQDGEIPDMSTPLKEYELFFTTTNGGGSWRAGLGGVY